MNITMTYPYGYVAITHNFRAVVLNEQLPSMAISGAGWYSVALLRSVASHGAQWLSASADQHCPSKGNYTSRS